MTTLCEELSAEYAERSRTESDPQAAAQFAVAAAITAAMAAFAIEMRLGLERSRAVDAIEHLAESVGLLSGVFPAG